MSAENTGNPLVEPVGENGFVPLEEAVKRRKPRKSAVNAAIFFAVGMVLALAALESVAIFVLKIPVGDMRAASLITVAALIVGVLSAAMAPREAVGNETEASQVPNVEAVPELDAAEEDPVDGETSEAGVDVDCGAERIEVAEENGEESVDDREEDEVEDEGESLDGVTECAFCHGEARLMDGEFGEDGWSLSGAIGVSGDARWLEIAVFDENGDPIDSVRREIKYCPECGRALDEEYAECDGENEGDVESVKSDGSSPVVGS